GLLKLAHGTLGPSLPVHGNLITYCGLVRAISGNPGVSHPAHPRAEPRSEPPARTRQHPPHCSPTPLEADGGSHRLSSDSRRTTLPARSPHTTPRLPRRSNFRRRPTGPFAVPSDRATGCPPP